MQTPCSGRELGDYKELQEGQYAQNIGTGDGDKASVQSRGRPSETLECHADAFVYILRPKAATQRF